MCFETLKFVHRIRPPLPGGRSCEQHQPCPAPEGSLYPSSAEVFGFVPYEAAALGTPSTFTNFGPHKEIARLTVLGQRGLDRTAGGSPRRSFQASLRSGAKSRGQIPGRLLFSKRLTASQDVSLGVNSELAQNTLREHDRVICHVHFLEVCRAVWASEQAHRDDYPGHRFHENQ